MTKKIFLISLFLLGCYSTSFSQLKEKDNLLGPSLGFWTKPNVPTFGLNFESEIGQLSDVGVIGIGGVLRYTKFKDSYPFDDYYDYSYITLGFQANLNFNHIGDGKFVPFVGLVLGYNNINSTYINKSGRIYTASYSSGFWLWGQAGLRYFFSEKIAGSIRLGAGNFNFDVIELGVDFKL